MAKSADYIGATGIGVSDLKRSTEFYERVLGMKAVQTIKLDYMDESSSATRGAMPSC